MPEKTALGGRRIWVGAVVSVLAMFVIAGIVSKGSGDKSAKADPLAELAVRFMVGRTHFTLDRPDHWQSKSYRR